jgi:prepilin-type N-terminal cleavage/methylation domain-containing protein
VAVRSAQDHAYRLVRVAGSTLVGRAWRLLPSCRLNPSTGTTLLPVRTRSQGVQNGTQNQGQRSVPYTERGVGATAAGVTEARHNCCLKLLEIGATKLPDNHNMMVSVHRCRRAFTLVEIMIVVAIIGMLAALMIPGFINARKQSQGRRILNDARQMDSAITRWALEKNMKDGDPINTTEAATSLKTAWIAEDVLGNGYEIGNVGSNQLMISSTTKIALSGVGIDWGSY